MAGSQTQTAILLVLILFCVVQVYCTEIVCVSNSYHEALNGHYHWQYIDKRYGTPVYLCVDCGWSPVYLRLYRFNASQNNYWYLSSNTDSSARWENCKYGQKPENYEFTFNECASIGWNHWNSTSGKWVDNPAMIVEICQTFEPSALPTSAPTSDPTTRPTNSPTDLPTNVPTSSPTVHPTLFPSENPTIDPTVAFSSTETFEDEQNITVKNDYIGLILIIVILIFLIVVVGVISVWVFCLKSDEARVENTLAQSQSVVGMTEIVPGQTIVPGQSPVYATGEADDGIEDEREAMNVGGEEIRNVMVPAWPI